MGLLGEVLDLVLPRTCAGCATPAREALCELCQQGLGLVRWPHVRVVAPYPRPVGLPPTVAAAAYDGVLRRLVTAHKDEGRRDLAPLLGGLLADGLAAVVVPGAVLVPAPSSRAARRRRGEHPLRELVRHALRGLAPAVPPGSRPEVVDALRVVRLLADQSGLDRAGRAANLRGAYALRPGMERRLRGREVVLVDDVLTTGATLAEAARALGALGCPPAAAVVVAATRLRGELPTSPAR